MIRTEKSVSILGAGYFQPVADLVSQMLKHSMAKRNAVRAAYYDNIYSASVILLLVAALESYATRLRYFKGPPPPEVRLTVAKYIEHVFSDFPFSKALTEVFVLRDVLFHNHLWVLESSWRPTKLHSATLVPHREDKKYLAVVNQRSRRTKNLRLHIVPTRVDRRDALKVIDTVMEVLLFIEGKNRNFCYVSHQNVVFKKRNRPFSDVRDALAASL
jgi:hypothetical protein